MTAESKEYKVRVATERDIDSIVDIHFKCFSKREHIATLLGRTFIRDVYKWLVNSEDCLAIVACQNDRIVGYNTACNGHYHQLMFRHNKASAVKQFLIRPWLIFSKPIIRRAWGSFFNSDPIDDKLKVGTGLCHFAFIGILPEHRRFGVGQSLTIELMRACQKKGWDKVRVLVYNKNFAPQNLLKGICYEENVIEGTGRYLYELDMKG